MTQTRILITGCACSGNTLMRRLWYAFEDVTVLRDKESDEVTLEQLLAAQTATRFAVGKRKARTVFSCDKRMDDRELAAQVGLIKKNGVKVLNMIRDGRDAILSQPRLMPRQWILCMRERRDHPGVIDLEVKYEDLVRNPDECQQMLVKRYGLEARHRFSEYPSFVPEWEWESRQSRHDRKRPRPISAGSVGKDAESHRKVVNRKPIVVKHFEDELRRAGYL